MYSVIILGMSTANITIYSATWCAFCHAAKDYLDRAGITYTDKDVDADPSAGLEAVNKSGQRGIPVIDIGGDIIVGFDRHAIDESIKKHAITS